MNDVINSHQLTLDDAKSGISILLHHDAITGTSSPTAELNWLEMISITD